MDNNVMADAIAGAPICAGMSPGNVQALARHLEARKHQQGDTLYREGSQEDTDLLIILEGQIEASSEHTHGVSEMLKIKLGAGDVAGIMGFIGGKPHGGTGVAATDCLVAHLSREQFASLCKADPGVGITMLRFLVIALDSFSVMLLARYNDSLSFMHGSKKK
ncbi:MAG: hypothetical protein AUJ57_07125 [Zetaproteobacteria bacterium CG1_02_53_45]|nr:MAG: hypothetical protein AUJ57_07125 [Zetaproteobacteria bacterium CG1_02_53_45]